MLKILAIVAAVAGAGLVATLTIWVPNLYESRATARAALREAVEANVSLIDERNRAKAEAERNQAISATAIRENRALDEKIAAVRERLRNGQACLIDPADADALDGLFR